MGGEMVKSCMDGKKFWISQFEKKPSLLKSESVQKFASAIKFPLLVVAAIEIIKVVANYMYANK